MQRSPLLSKYGALPSQTIRAMMSAGFIENADSVHVAPGSLDLTLSDEIYRVEGIFQLHPGESVRTLLTHIEAERHLYEEPLRRNHLYLARLSERIELPAGVYGYCNPKSSTGRLDIHVRVLADGVPRYDTLAPEGWKGELWLAILPKSFSVLLAPGLALSQLRLFTGDTRFDELDFQIALAEHKLLWDQEGSPIRYHDLYTHDRDGAAVLTADLGGTVLGWQSRETDEPIDLLQVESYDPDLFFEPVVLEQDYLRLLQNKFYILSTHEAVRVPPELACEMAPMDERSGDFRSHYAGFIDPGWGWGASGEGAGRPLTLEVRPFEDLVIRHGQPIAKIRFERMTHIPDVVYDAASSHYTGQYGPKLAKQFRG